MTEFCLENFFSLVLRDCKEFHYIRVLAFRAVGLRQSEVCPPNDSNVSITLKTRYHHENRFICRNQQTATNIAYLFTDENLLAWREQDKTPRVINRKAFITFYS